MVYVLPRPMNSRCIPIIVLIALFSIRFTNLAGINHAYYSSNYQIVGAEEDSILLYLDNNPIKSDSIASALFSRFKGVDKYAEGIALYYKGESAYYLQKWSAATQFYQEAFERFSLAGDSVRMASSSNNLGLVYYYLGQFDKAIDAFGQSLTIELALKNETGIAQSYQNMALMFEQAGQKDKAMGFYQEALEIYIDQNMWKDAAGVYNNLAIIAADESDWAKAESYYLKALDIYQQQGSKAREATVLCNIGSLLLRQMQFEKAAEMAERALVMMQAAGDNTGEISAYSLLGDIYSAQQEYQQAVFLYKKAHDLASRMNSADLMLSNLYSLYLGYKNSRQFEEALQTHEQYQALRDSFFKENPVYKQVVINQELERQLAERELQSYKARVRERIYWVMLIVTVLLAGVIALYLIFRRKRAERLVSQHRFGQKFIQSQMDTHFVFSMLSSLQGHIISGNNDLALDHLNNVAVLLRKIFENTGKGLIPLSHEIDFLNAYFCVQRQRFSKEIGFTIECNVGQNDNSVLVPFMVTKPFIENAITNGLFNKQERPQFNIAFMRQGDRLEVTIEDNSPALPASFKNRQLEEQLKKTGIPIAEKHLFVSRRKASAQYAISSLRIEDKSRSGMGPGTRIRFCFPIVTAN